MFKATKILLIIFVVLFISLFGVLFSSGIKINSFSFANVSFSQFYIKFDKKLIVDIDTIRYESKESKVENSFDDIQKDIELLPTLLKYFQEIHIESLVIDGNKFTLNFNNDMIYFDSKFLNFSTDIEYLSDQSAFFNIYSLYLKDLDIIVDGKIKLDYIDEKISHVGNYYYKNITGKLKLDINEDFISFYVDSRSFKSLDFIKDFTRLSPDTESWMYDRVLGDIKFHDVYGKFDINKNELVESSLQGSAVIDNATIKFHDDLKEIETKRVDVSLKNKQLSFNLVEPKYYDIPMDGSSVVLNDFLSGENGEVVVNIKTDSKLDKRISKILETYEINLPLIQKTGVTNAELSLTIPYEESKDITSSGNFIVNDANINIENFPFYTKKTTVILDDSLVKITDGHFKHKDLIDANVNLDINTDTLLAKGKADINSLVVEADDTSILNIKDKKTNLELDLNDDVRISLDAIKTDIVVSKLTNVYVKDFSILYDNSDLLKDIGVKDGNLALKIKDENNISFKGFVSGLDYPIQKDNKQIKSLNIVGDVKQNETIVSSISDDIKVKIKDKKTTIDLKNIDIVIDTKKEEKGIDTKLFVNLENSRLKIDEDIYDIAYANNIIEKDKVIFDGKIKNIYPLKKDSKKLEYLELQGEYSKGLLVANTKDKGVKLKLVDEDVLTVDIDGYDVIYKTDDKSELKSLSKIDIKAKNSNIFYNDKHKLLANSFEVRTRDDSEFVYLKYENSDITYKKSQDKKVELYANNINDEFINSIFDNKILNGGNFMILASGDENNLSGKVLINNSTIKDLAVLNNLLLLIHSSPALINPLLAIPSLVGTLTNDGFALNGYKVIDGVIEFDYDNKGEILKVNKLTTVGNGIDFKGSGVIDVRNQTINSDVDVIFFKNYSKIVGSIPVVNYVLLGKNNRIETQVNLFGPLNNPKISTNFTKEAFSVPLNIAKRLLESPSEMLEFIKGKNQEENKENNKEEKNK